jgi:hypothetical protein
VPEPQFYNLLKAYIVKSKEDQGPDIEAIANQINEHP